MKIGVLGVGALAEALISGVQASNAPFEWYLSPRSAERVARLKHLDGVHVADDNATVLNSCQTVLVGVRPQHLDDLTQSLQLTPKHHVISLVAGVDLSTLERAFYPAGVTRMMASIAVAYPGSSVFLYPQDSRLAKAFLEAGYGVQTFVTEPQFEASMLSVCVNAWWLQQVQALAETFASQTGMSVAEATQLLARAQQEASLLLQHRQEVSAAALAGEIGSPGTFTARGLDYLKTNKAEQPWVDLLSQLLSDLKQEISD